MKRLLFLAALLFALPAAAQMSGAFPWSEPFDESSSYGGHLCAEGGPGDQSECQGHLAWTHETSGCWSGGCAKFRFINSTGEDNAGLSYQGLIFPSAPPIVYIRYLIYYGSTYCTVQTQGMKTMILQSNAGGSGARGMTFDQDSSTDRAVYACQNNDCGAAEQQEREAGKTLYNMCARTGEWISYEAKFDQTNDTASIYVDTQDGVQNSAGGAAPYQVYNGVTSTGGWKNLEWLMGYIEAIVGADANSYFILDELRINTSYIGPPSGGSCAGTPAQCDDGNFCTDEACNPATGQCAYTINDNPCSDGNACTTGDVCGPNPTTLFAETFDDVVSPALPAGWVSTQSPAGATPWTTSAAFWVSAPTSATTDTPPSLSDKTLDSPAFPGGLGMVLTFDHRYNFEFSAGGPTYYDGAVLEIKIGASPFTDIVTAGGSFALGGYTGTIANGFSSPIAGRQAWGAASTGFVATQVNLPASAAGQTVVLRWRVATDSSDAAEAPIGQWIDNVLVTANVAGCYGAPASCDDGNVCTDDSCNPATGCVHVNNTAPCNDGNACTTSDTCSAGACVGGPAPNCDDGNPCTDDSCSPGTGCVYVNNTAPCDDANACTTADTCSGGICVGGPAPNCDDGNPCTDDSCSPAIGCVYVNNLAPCDDANACTTSDTCSGGACVGGPAPNCDDGNVCTDDSCNPATGCVYVNNTAPCSDGDACTTADTCAGGLCVAGPALNCDDGNGCTDDSCNPAIGCVYVNNTAPCDDANACTTADTCAGGACVGGPAPNCDDGNVCTGDSCSPATGCVHVNNTAPCNDGIACTTADTCSGGICVGGPAPNCDDGNPCTDDSCNPATGCVYVNNTAPCSDGDACTTADTCAGGACVGGPAPNCDDGNVCTGDSCNTSTGCVHVNNTAPCDDANACTTSDTCSGGACVGGPAPNCDDGNVCTDDSCNPATGCVYVNNTAPCSDGDACTTADTCSGGICLGGPAPNCDDGNVCTDDSCSPATGCVHVNNTAPCSDGNACTTSDTCSAGACVGGPAPNCDDGNPCTDDSCSPGTGCVYVNNTAPCDDANACTTSDTCSGGACVGGPAPNCDDGNPCTDDSCNTSTGCVHVNNTAPCSDGNACTTSDTCSGGTCVGGPAPNCDDGNVCTDDSCSPSIGCVTTNNTTPCDDGNACTTSDTCGGGTCVGGPAPNCDDSNGCTDDSCSPSIGCVHVNNTAPCSDGNACTAADTCSAGVCISGPAPNCNDGNVCTDDSCSPATGCVNTNNTTPCDDGNACTTADTCAGGACVGGPAPNCDDGNVCTDDSCSPSIGCVHVNNTAPCSDGNACTTADTCSAGGCVGGPALNCDDGNPCTDDSCSPATGCVHVNNMAPCSDGNACTTSDTCSGGTCVGGPAPSCDDSNSCTDDSCSPATGCINTNNTASCNDGNACTTADTCSGGACVGGPAPSCDDGNPCTADSCSPAIGCVNTNNTAPCDDANACTTVDTCSGGTCVGGPAPNCDDWNGCTDDSCSPATGCVHVNNSAPCSDGNACTTSDVCGGGTCVGGPAPNCNDGNPCTDDSCSPATGCVNTNNTNPCDDDDDCTSGDICGEGSCTGTPMVPPETTGMLWEANKRDINWNSAPFAERYDVVRGSLRFLPVGPGGSDETCFGDLSNPDVSDETSPGAGTGFWYLSRGRNDCGVGTWGTTRTGIPRITTTCP